MTERKKYKISPKIKVNFFKDKSDQRKNSQAHTSSHFKRIKKNVIKNIKMSIARASIVVKKILSYQELSFEQFQSTLIHSSFFLLFYYMKNFSFPLFPTLAHSQFVFNKFQSFLIYCVNWVAEKL